MARRGLSWLLTPIHAAAFLTARKSFRDNPVIGDPKLNEAGLHIARVRLADRLAQWRRQRLAPLIGAEDLADFERDGVVARPDFLPENIFANLKTALLNLEGPARALLEGDAVTRRIPLDARARRRVPELAALLDNPRWLGLIRYAGASALAPVSYMQTVFSQVCPGAPDPQLRLHSDTFHSTVKAWFFLNDVSEEDGPFTYVPGSHRLTPARAQWLKQMSVVAARSSDNETQEGSFRIAESALAGLDLPPPRRFAVPANTLIVADTMGLHARGASARPGMRMEIFASHRRNPFLPWLGGDPAGWPLIEARAARLAWAMDDLGERLGGKPNRWRKCGTLTPAAALNMDMFETQTP